MRVLTTEGTETAGRDGVDHYEHEAADIELKDYAQELAFLPDLSETSITKLYYTATNVQNPELSPERPEGLVEVLKNHEGIMISSGNALPPSAY
ncbi:hypothetical protein PC129_g20348 [Phytophthora cactorum]|uniref:Uncharacterized protein n=1 Tax=Phytophthora cactorum TaxID=29920 RepID=A0A8T0YMY7_9STRA|nr:hypothetical protein Pcac1_g16290 [Phytophthora cactorum]KAG2798935.1 hypothetical protein PC112_g21137 [Phytophthora cactorum]KAG2806084.1 hypothetical protein PC111_g17530 [Phytophthora cactorum]KAG2851313.1 hypothetical protein PC113_g16015 [Phytophthora cactorum]KAG2886068.1 hypothetical protein PC115_g20783 [Phytophthora cactorum]